LAPDERPQHGEVALAVPVLGAEAAPSVARRQRRQGDNQVLAFGLVARNAVPSSATATGDKKTHHILAHIDYLDETVATLSERIEQLIAPFSKERELLMTIPGVARVSAEVLI